MNILELIGKLGVYHALSMMVIGQMLMIGMPMKGSPKGEDAPLIDTLLHIREVVVTARQPFHEVIPVQRLKGERLQQLNSQSVADALRYFSGLQIKDYGGVGGIKTVNIRSMGTNHLGIFYDGMELGNAQNGQTDLGQYSLDNVEEIALYNGQKSDILQSAADYAKAGTVYIRTRQPQFAEGEQTHLHIQSKWGASNTLRLSTLLEQRLSNRTSLSLSVGGLSSNGKYEFRYKRKNLDGTTAYDTTAVRENGDIWAVRAEGNLFGTLSEGTWNMKVYTYHSERGIPGAIVNNVWRRGERQGDHNTFVQGAWQKTLLPWLTSRVLAKYAYYNTHYVNKDTTRMLIDNTYEQQELSLSTTQLFRLKERWTVSLSYDFKWNSLDADIQRFVYPKRHAHLIALATAIDLGQVKIQSSVVETMINDRQRKKEGTTTTDCLSPALFVNYSPTFWRDLSLRAFAKKSFRMPTFNDLYYTEVGNAELKPEKATQYNIGLVVEHHFTHGPLAYLRWQTDAYLNKVDDKIIAYPKGEQFRWTMLNLGEVDIKGVDLACELGWRPAKRWRLNTRMQYTWQQARDVTDTEQSFYHHQIPYIPWHSGSVVVNIVHGGLSVNYSFIYAGERYSQQENIARNHLQPWYTSDVSASYAFTAMKTRWKIGLEVNNIFSQDYDVILNYPMPKRNAAVSLSMEW